MKPRRYNHNNTISWGELACLMGFVVIGTAPLWITIVAYSFSR